MLRFRARLTAFPDTTGAEFLGAAVMLWVGAVLTTKYPNAFQTGHAWGPFFCAVGSYIWTARVIGSPKMRAFGLTSGAGLCALMALLQAQAGAYVGFVALAITAMVMTRSAFTILFKD